MKNLFSRTFAVVLSAMILAVPAFATQLRPCLDPVVPAEAETTEIQPRATTCVECGGDTRYYEEHYETAYQDKLHLAQGSHWDTVKIERTKVGYKCIDCGFFDYRMKEEIVDIYCPKGLL